MGVILGIVIIVLLVLGYCVGDGQKEGDLSGHVFQRAGEVTGRFLACALFGFSFTDERLSDAERKRGLMFLFGGLDAIIAATGVPPEDKMKVLYVFLATLLPDRNEGGIRALAEFLCDASADSKWQPIMTAGGQAVHDWLNGSDGKYSPLSWFNIAIGLEMPFEDQP